MPTQRYVSPELTHFVGNRLSSEDHQYSLLVNDILKGGCLMYSPIDDRQCNEGLSGSPLVGGTHTPDVDDTEAAYSRVICFCDIPVTDLAIHMTKYSRFGLSFLKPFLVRKGANPVLYVANNSQPQTPRTPELLRTRWVLHYYGFSTVKRAVRMSKDKFSVIIQVANKQNEARVHTEPMKKPSKTKRQSKKRGKKK
jgi:hypothetical protein